MPWTITITSAAHRSLFAQSILLAFWVRLKGILGDYLFEGMEGSWFRYMERQTEVAGLTSAVSLQLASSPGDDFKLTVNICGTTGEAIRANKAGLYSVEVWEPILGEYLFSGMMASNRRKGEEPAAISAGTSALNVVSFVDGDYTLMLMLGFEVGRHIWHQCF